MKRFSTIDAMKHHHVPQFLLKSWASEKDGKIEVFYLNRQHLPSSRHTPEYTGFEVDLYALNDPQVAGIERQALEEGYFKQMDTWASNVLHKFNDTGLENLTEEDRCVWVCFIILLLWRNPDAISYFDTEGSKYLRDSLNENPEEYNQIAEFFDPSTFAEWTDKNFPGYIENFGKLHLPKMVRHRLIEENVGSMRWWLFNFNDQDNHLLLADRPCIFTTGLDDSNLVIALPIGPRKAFMATKSDRTANILKQQRRKDLLVRINESSMRQAQEYIWALDNSPRRFIENRLHNRQPS